MIRRSRGVPALLLLVLLLGGCANDHLLVPASYEEVRPQWESRKADLYAVDSFSIQGRIAEGGIAGGSGTIDWTQVGSHFEARVSGPLGVGALLLSGNPGNVEVHTKDGIFQTDDPASFMRDSLGWSLPLPRLRYWILGVPAPADANDGGAGPEASRVSLDTQGHAISIRQDGWEITFDDYLPVHGTSLPHKLGLTDGQHHLRMIVDDWAGLESARLHGS